MPELFTGNIIELPQCFLLGLLIYVRIVIELGPYERPLWISSSVYLEPGFDPFVPHAARIAGRPHPYRNINVLESPQPGE